MEVEFDDLWSLRENTKFIEKNVQAIKKQTRSVHIQEILVDERVLSAIQKNFLILNKYLSSKKQVSIESKLEGELKIGCSICGKPYCYARNHVELCTCGFYDNMVDCQGNKITFKCLNCGKIRLVNKIK